MDKDLKSKTFNELGRLVAGLGEKKYLAGYIFSFIHTRAVRDISEITPLSKSFRGKLIEQGYYISSLEIVDKLTDPDGTVKYVFSIGNQQSAIGNKIESVLLFDPVKSKRFPGLSPGNSKGISQGDGPSRLRRTLCVSTQVGCAMGCVFCATGRLGLSRNLTSAEIVDQVNLVELDSRYSILDTRTSIAHRVSNVVFMGMGEPLANYDAVLTAIRILNHPKGKNIGIRHLTVSTCGLPEGIERLAEEDIRPRLAISLNAPTDAIRRRLMPIAKKHTLGRLLAAVGLYQRKTHNRVTFEYCLIKGVNDTVLHARLLVKRLRGFMCNVNLIEFNPYNGCDLKPSGKEALERFAAALKEAGIETTVRQKFGRTINAACGQLGASS
ncbi:MAG: 23S rRNA (adenine(2503)-C(2))-methyltransferase RlmN [Planctomycetota bacterium]